MGEYYPVFTFFPNSNGDRQIIKLAPVAVLGKLTCPYGVVFIKKFFKHLLISVPFRNKQFIYVTSSTKKDLIAEQIS